MLPWLSGVEGDTDHAYIVANPAGPVNLPRLSAMLYSPLSFPLMSDGTRVVDPTDSAKLICVDIVNKHVFNRLI